MPTNDAGPPEGEVPAQDPIEEIAHTAMDAGEGEVAEGELLDESVDEIVIDSGGDEIARLTAERDEYLAHLQRTQAEFDNYRKRMLRDQTTHLERAASGLDSRRCRHDIHDHEGWNLAAARCRQHAGGPLSRCRIDHGNLLMRFRLRRSPKAALPPYSAGC